MTDLSFLNVISKFATKDDRKKAAKELAAILNAEDIIIFIQDPINSLLPAPGFPQTLQGAEAWDYFLNKSKNTLYNGFVPYPDKNSLSPAIGIPVQNSVVVLIGGNSTEKEIEQLKAISPIIIALLKEELISLTTSSRIVTANKEIEKAERIAKALDGIRKKLNLSYVELSKKNQQLIKINNDLDNFIYTASHDLRAPVSNLEGLLNTYFSEIEINSELKPVVDMMFESIERFKNTIIDLTDIAKVQKGDEEDVELVDFYEMVKEVKLNISGLIKSKNAEVFTNFQVDKIKYSRKNLRSIIYNLVSNAIKYSSLERIPKVNITTTKQGEFTLLTVSDNGLGLTKDNLTKLFGIFKRMHPHVEGTGIGLYMVKRMIENSGGRIEVESKEGEGSIFKVYLSS